MQVGKKMENNIPFEDTYSAFRPEALVFQKKVRFGPFEVEVANDKGAAVFHFYKVEMPTHLWDTEDADTPGSFAAAISEALPAAFDLTYPALKAARTNELGIDSWWVRAEGVFARFAADTRITQALLQVAEKCQPKS